MSTTCAISSEKSRCVASSRPKNGSALPLPREMDPTLALIPYFVTMVRAIEVAFSKSFDAPVVGSLKTISSAMRPPIA